MSTQRPVPAVFEQLERIEAQLAFLTATLQRHGLMLERIAGTHPSAGLTHEDVVRAAGAMRVPGGMKDP